MKKGILAVFLACALAAGTAAGPAGVVTVLAEEGQGNVTEDGFQYRDIGDGIEITGYTGSVAEVIIPNTISGKTVTSIGDSAFSQCRGLTSVSIPASVTSIGKQAFMWCVKLTSVNIPEGVTSIGDSAFSQCSRLTSVSIPASVTDMGWEVFAGAPWRSEHFMQNNGLLIVNHVVVDAQIGGRASIPEGVTGIRRQAFGMCPFMTSVSIPASVTWIEDAAFSYCGAMSGGLKDVYYAGSQEQWEKITIGNDNGDLLAAAIRYNSFEPEDSESDVTADGFHYRDIGSGIIITSYTGSATVIRIPETISGKTVTGIGAEAFKFRNDLTVVSIPKGMTSIGDYAFTYCICLKDVYYAGSQEQWEKIKISDSNGCLLRAAIQYNYSGSGNAGSDKETSQKTAQSVTATDITKTYGAKPFSLGAKSSAGVTLSYTVTDPKVATVDTSGKVTIKGCGITSITITAAETSKYNKAQKTITLTVKPKKMTLSSVKSKKKKTAIVKWKKDKTASGYIIERATDKKFKKNKVKTEIKKNKTTSTTVKKLKAGKKYYVRICAYAKSGKTKLQGDWSKAKTVRVKK